MIAVFQRAEQSAPDDRATQFTAVDAQSTERFSGPALLVQAYAAIWILVMAWILFLWRKQASLSDRLDGLERSIDRAAAAQERAATAPKTG